MTKAVRITEGLPAAPGEYLLTKTKGVDGFTKILIGCPCGCGAIIGADFGPDGWMFDGNEEAPTLSPSLQVVGGCGWHGFLRAGVFESV